MLHSFLSLIAHAYRPGATTFHTEGRRLRGCTTLRDKRQVGAVIEILGHKGTERGSGRAGGRVTGVYEVIMEGIT